MRRIKSIKLRNSYRIVVFTKIYSWPQSETKNNCYLVRMMLQFALDLDRKIFFNTVSFVCYFVIAQLNYHIKLFFYAKWNPHTCTVACMVAFEIPVQYKSFKINGVRYIIIAIWLQGKLFAVVSQLSKKIQMNRIVIGLNLNKKNIYDKNYLGAANFQRGLT